MCLVLVMESLLVHSLLACLIACLWGLLYWRPYRRLWLLAGKIPGPRGHPFIGSALIFLRKPTEILPALMKIFAEYGPTVRLWLGPGAMILITDPDDIKAIHGDPMIRNREKKITDAMVPFFGNGLLTLRGETWKTHRKLMAPAFHNKILESFVEVFGKKSKIFVERLEAYGGKSFNAHDPLVLFTLDSICETTIGTAGNSQEKGQNDFVDCFQRCEKLVQYCVCRPWLWVQSIYALSSTCRESQPLIKTMHAFSESVVAQKLDEYRRGIRSKVITTDSKERTSSFLDMLIEASENQGSILTAEEMRDEVTAIASAGVETTATALSFCLVLIAMHSEVQAELHRELDEVFGSDDRAATTEDLKQLPALERCIKETLRHFPVVPLSPREIDKDVHLPSGYTIPAGSTVVVFPYAVHRDPRFYVDPHKFWPDRWLPENCKDLHPYAYIPFSAGPRNCIGQRYAQLQLKSVVSQLLRCYRLSTPLTMTTLQTLVMSVSLSIDEDQEGQYCIKLHKL